MNNFNNVAAFLKQNQKLHARITDFYRSLSIEVNNQRIKLLLDLLIKHELDLLDFINTYLEKASNKTRETFVQFDPEQNVDDLFLIDFNPEKATREQVEALATSFNQYLTNIYQGISESNESQEVALLFDNLRQHIEQQKKQLTIDANEMNDI